MRKNFSVLTVYAIIFLVGCIGFSIYNYEQLAEGEGWGMVGMFGLAGVGILMLFAGIALNNIIRNKVLANLIGLAVAIGVTLLLIFGN